MYGYNNFNVPHTRGDEPRHRRNNEPVRHVPHTRGDEPSLSTANRLILRCSPHISTKTKWYIGLAPSRVLDVQQRYPLSAIHNSLFTIYYLLSTTYHPPFTQKSHSLRGFGLKRKIVPDLRTGDAGIELFCYNSKLNWHIKEEKTEWVKLKLSQRKKPQA